MLVVRGVGESASVEGTVGGRPVSFFYDTGGHAALVGFDMELAAGWQAWRIEIREPGLKPRSLSGVVSVGRREFPVQRLTLPTPMVDLDPETERRATTEAGTLRGLYRTLTPERFWRGPFLRPVAGDEPGSGFGSRRIINGQPRSPHGGTDYAAPRGTPVLSVNDGQVVLLADLDPHLLEVKVQRVQTETVVDDDETAGEEVFGHQRDATAVDRRDRRPSRGGVVGAAVGRPGLAVDDPPRPKAGPRLVAGDRTRERAPPETLRGDGPIEPADGLGLGHRPSLGLGIEIDHRRRQRQSLHGKFAPAHRHHAAQRARRTPGLADLDAPGLAARRQLHVEPDQRAVSLAIANEGHGTTTHDPFDDRVLGRPADKE